MDKNIVEAMRKSEVLKADIMNLNDRIESAALLLAPDEGWPGKNEEARRSAREKALEKDDYYTDMVGQLQAKREILGGLLGEIAAFEALRREAEWELRRRYIEAVTARAVVTRVPSATPTILPGEDALWGAQ